MMYALLLGMKTITMITAESRVKNRQGQEHIDIQHFPRTNKVKVGEQFKYGRRWYRVTSIDEVVPPASSKPRVNDTSSDAGYRGIEE